MTTPRDDGERLSGTYQPKGDIATPATCPDFGSGITKPDDGGPAYPSHPTDFPKSSGMSLRDAFAISALQGLLAYSGEDDGPAANIVTEEGKRLYLKIAENCFRYADAMLAARRA